MFPTFKSTFSSSCDPNTNTPSKPITKYIKDEDPNAISQALMHSLLVWDFNEFNMGKRFYWNENATKSIDTPFTESRVE